MILNRRHAAAAFVAAALLPRASIAANQTQTGPVWLTIGGAVGNVNRPSLGENREGFFKHHNIAFNRAVVFTREALLALPQHVVETDTKTAGPGRFAGPRLADVLSAAGAASAVRLIALDGFAAELTQADVAAGWILALSQNGAAFGVGDLGPCWLMRQPPASAANAFEEEAEKWVWSVFYIEAMT